jgi:hypothetical protein
MGARVRRRRVFTGREPLACLLGIVLVAGCGGAAAPTSPTPAPAPAATASAQLAASPPGSHAPVAGPSTTAEPSAATAAPTTESVADPPGTPASVDPWPLGDGWPVIIQDHGRPVAVGPGATAYAWIAAPSGEPVVAALDPAGRLKPGWPFAIPTGSMAGDLEVLSDGSLLVEVTDGRASGLTLHRLSADGREVAGWPFVGGSFLGEAPDGTLYVRVGTAGSWSGGATLTALDPAGRAREGWPVDLPAEALEASWGPALRVADDGTIHVMTATDVERQPRYGLWALSPGGRVRPGWPIALGTTRSAFTVAPGGRVLVTTYVPPDVPVGGLCGEAARTDFTEYDAHGRIVPGWPRTAPGMASQPAVADDGTVYYLTRNRVTARDPDGSTRAGWPVRIPDVYPECGGYGPWLGADGTVYVTAEGLRAFSPTGALKPGWPYVPAGGFPVAPCMADVVTGPPPALDPDGRVYVATVAPGSDETWERPTEIVALDADGSVASGWPFVLPLTRPSGVESLVAADGRVYATVRGCGDAFSGLMLLALEPDGTIAE